MQEVKPISKFTGSPIRNGAKEEEAGQPANPQWKMGQAFFEAREARIFLGFLNWARTRPVAFLYGPRPGASSLIDTHIHHPSLILTLTLTKHQKLHLPLHLLYLHPTSYLSLTISSSSHIIFTLTSLNLPPPTLSYQKTTSLHRHSHIARQPSLYRHSHIAKQPSLHQEITISLSIPSFNTRPWA